MPWNLLANATAVLHGLIVAYIAGGFLFLLAGLWRKWRAARNFVFRYTHLWFCLVVMVFECANLHCPLTDLEDWLRGHGTETEAGFIQRYITEPIHVDMQPRELGWLMLAVLLGTVLLYFWRGPERPEPSGKSDGTPPQKTSALRKVFTVLGLVLLSAGCIPVLRKLHLALPGNGAVSWISLALAFGLCLVTPRRCGLGLGEFERWRRFDWKILLVWAVPPLSVITIYADYTSRPYEDIAWHKWLLGSAAQEYLFTGFVYARLIELWGERRDEKMRDDWRGAFAAPMLLTAALFSLWHWPGVYGLQPSYLAFQFIYTFLGGWWMLNMRRWTGSVWPGVTVHILVNYLASTV
ncbi:MAG: DUF2784 family protein [Planctomycetes bacterium]|nr:DUF2784 family protein [Planctomycetota bacterium]